MCDEPASNLDERVDDLLRALGAYSAPADLAAVFRFMEHNSTALDIDNPHVIGAMELGPVFGALAGILDEVLVLRAIAGGNI